MRRLLPGVGLSSKQEPLTGGGVPNLYKLSDYDLKKRSEEGDRKAERVLQDRVIVRGLVLNDPTYTDQHWTWLDTQLCVHFKRSAAHPRRVRLILKINESTTVEFLQLHWSEVRWWRKFLRNLQGPEPSGTESVPGQETLAGSGHGPPPWLRLQRDNDKRPYVSILLNDTIEVPEIKRCWSWVRSYRRFVREDFGPVPHSADGYLSRLNELHNKGMSYADIARLVEEEARSWLARYMYQLRGWFDENLVMADEWTADQEKHLLEECSAALYGFNVLKCGREDISEWLRLTLRSMVMNSKARLKQADATKWLRDARLKRADVPDWEFLSPSDFVLNRETIAPVVEREKVIHALRKFRNRGKKGLAVR